jgi:hypothetical protein
MHRRDGSANLGAINWPTHLANSGEGGLYVYAVVGAIDPDSADSFDACVVSHPVLPLDTLLDPDPAAGDLDAAGKQRWPLEEKWFPTSEFEAKLWSRDLYAAVLLGSSGGSWVTTEGDHWICRHTDLRPEGVKLVAGLEELYGQPVALLTFLDT